MLQQWFAALDQLEPFAVFWAVVIWLLVGLCFLALVRVGSSAEGQGRGGVRRSQASVEMISKNRRTS